MQKGHLLTGMIVQGWKDFNFLLLGKILRHSKKTLSLVFSKMLMEKKKNINMNDYNIFLKQAIFIFDKNHVVSAKLSYHDDKNFLFYLISSNVPCVSVI